MNIYKTIYKRWCCGHTSYSYAPLPPRIDNRAEQLIRNCLCLCEFVFVFVLWSHLLE